LADVRRSHPEAVVAFRVFELESELGGWVADSTEVCQARESKPHNYIDHEVVRSAAEAHIAVTHPIDSWLVSLTMDARWAIFEVSIQLGRTKGKHSAVINEIKLVELPFLVNCSTREMCESLALSGHVLIQATSAGEVFTTEVPKKALTGRVLLLSQNTSGAAHSGRRRPEGPRVRSKRHRYHGLRHLR